MSEPGVAGSDLDQIAEPGAGASDLDQIAEAVLRRLEAKHAQRELVLQTSRRLVQCAARSIRAIHRGEWSAASALLAEGEALLADMHQAAGDHADLAAAGYLIDAQKEYAEARLTWALLRSEPLPAPDDLGVADAAWLNGLGEAAAELRRAVLDGLRRGEVSGAEALLARMDEIYAFLSTVDFPSAITGDIRRTNDMVRGVVERTRGDLTMAVRQEELRRAVDRFEARLAAGKLSDDSGVPA